MPTHRAAEGEIYRPRLVDQRLPDLLEAFPAVLLNGPRAAGKTTTARQHAAAEVRLDQPAQAAAFKADPDAALRGHQRRCSSTSGRRSPTYWAR